MSMDVNPNQNTSIGGFNESLINQTQQAPDTNDAVASNTQFRDVAELKTKAPEVWEGMMKGITNGILDQMRRHQRRMKEVIRESKRQ